MTVVCRQMATGAAGHAYCIEVYKGGRAGLTCDGKKLVPGERFSDFYDVAMARAFAYLREQDLLNPNGYSYVAVPALQWTTVP